MFNNFMSFSNFIKDMKDECEKISDNLGLRIDKNHVQSYEISLYSPYIQYRIYRITWGLTIATWILALATIILIFVTK